MLTIRSQRHSARGILGIFSLIVAVPSSLYPFELLSHFAVYWILIAIFGALITLRTHDWLGFCLCLLIATAHARQILQGPIVWLETNAEDETSRTTGDVSIISANVQGKADSARTVAQFATEQNADLLFIQELTPEAQGALATTAWKEVISQPRTDHFGMGIWARHHGIQARAREPIANNLVTELTLELGGQMATVVHIHPDDPIWPQSVNRRDAVFRWIAQTYQSHRHSLIVLGDFNSTPWSPTMDHFASLNLRFFLDAWTTGTWPSWLPVRIPIDLVAVGSDLQPLKIKNGPRNASDHLPLLVQINRR